MAVKLRLARHGSKKHPFYRIVAANDYARRDGLFLEHVGSYDPAHTPPAVALKRDRIKHWLDAGATPTDTVKDLLNRFMDGQDTAIRPVKKVRAVAAKPAAAHCGACARPMSR